MESIKGVYRRMIVRFIPFTPLSPSLCNCNCNYYHMAVEGLDTRLNRALWKESGKLKFCDELHTDTPGESCGQPPILRSPSPKCWTRKSVRQFAFPWIETKCNTFHKWKLNHEGEMAKLIFRGWMREGDRNLSNLRVLKRLTLLAKHRFLTRKKNVQQTKEN